MSYSTSGAAIKPCCYHLLSSAITLDSSTVGSAVPPANVPSAVITTYRNSRPRIKYTPLLAIGCWLYSAGWRVLAGGCRLYSAGYTVLAGGCWLEGAGGRVLAVAQWVCTRCREGRVTVRTRGLAHLVALRGMAMSLIADELEIWPQLHSPATD